MMKFKLDINQSLMDDQRSQQEQQMAQLQEQMFRAEGLLADSGAHKPLLLLARGEVALLANQTEQATR